jgi:hypothetical protein
VKGMASTHCRSVSALYKAASPWRARRRRTYNCSFGIRARAPAGVTVLEIGEDSVRFRGGVPIVGTGGAQMVLVLSRARFLAFLETERLQLRQERLLLGGHGGHIEAGASIPMRQTLPNCCARTASGQAAAPPTRVMNSRRLRSSMGSSPNPLCQLSAGSGCSGSARRSLG